MMNKIIVGSDIQSTVMIGNGFLDDIGFYIPAQHSNSKIAIITDDVVAKLYLNSIISSLESYRFHPVFFVLPHGNINKFPKMHAQIMMWLGANHITKSDLVISLGGGMVHDLVGFSSGIYLQGINYITIPTTLTSMIDTAIGGTTYMNTPVGKNKVGISHFPLSVLIDVKTLLTNPITQLYNGIAQVIKYGVIYDKNLLTTIFKTNEPECIINGISQLIRIKNNILFLNSTITNPLILEFGSTIGDIVESHSNYKFSSDEAVAIGMAMITRLSEQKQLTRSGTYRTLTDHLKKWNCPIEYNLPYDYFMKMIMSDKKFDGDILNLVILKEIQKPQIIKVNRKEIGIFFADLFK